MKTPNLNYHAALFLGRATGNVYRALLPFTAKFTGEPRPDIEADVYSFSCERDLAEQVASIHTFLRNVGVPKKFTVVSDGTYKSSSIERLKSIDSCVRTVDYRDLLQSNLPDSVIRYASSHPLGKKLAMVMSLPVQVPTIYVDSDIVFFKGGDDLVTQLNLIAEVPLCLLDCNVALDKRMLDAGEDNEPINSGFFVLSKQIDWQFAIERLERVSEYSYFTEQTAIHLALKKAGAVPLDASKYIVQLDDQVMFKDSYAARPIAMRHYCGPVRHKFWSYLFER